MTMINWLMLFREIIAVYSEDHTKHVNALCGQNVELLNVKAGGTYSNHCVRGTAHWFGFARRLQSPGGYSRARGAE
jgi:hypothetical protein